MLFRHTCHVSVNNLGWFPSGNVPAFSDAENEIRLKIFRKNVAI